ncbi:MAG: hypothetical protein ACI4KR_04225 [Ruminiclostridium sp.]
MDKKEKRIAYGGFGLSVFLLLCAVINLFSGHIGAVIACLGAGFFFFALASSAYKKAGETKGDENSNLPKR